MAKNLFAVLQKLFGVSIYFIFIGLALGLSEERGDAGGQSDGDNDGKRKGLGHAVLLRLADRHWPSSRFRLRKRRTGHSVLTLCPNGRPDDRPA
jgi:hypothetical protein